MTCERSSASDDDDQSADPAVARLAWLFLILDDEIGFRINAPFWRLIRHGHLRLVLEAGPKIFAYGALHGVTPLGQLRRLVKSVSSSQQAAWERADAS